MIDTSVARDRDPTPAQTRRVASYAPQTTTRRSPLPLRRYRPTDFTGDAKTARSRLDASSRMDDAMDDAADVDVDLNTRSNMSSVASIPLS